MKRLWPLLVLLLAAFAVQAQSIASSSVSGCDDAVAWQRVVPGVWAWPPAEPAEVAPDNLGHVITPSVVIDQGEALLIDPGPSDRLGHDVRRSIECRFGAKVVAIVNTHAHSENVLANSAFSKDIAAGSLRVFASEATRDGMRLRCESCLRSLVSRVGEQAMKGTRIVLPTDSLKQGDELSVGRVRLQVALVATGHTEGDLVLWWPERRVMWAGGLVYPHRIPELAQGQLIPWVRALDQLIALRPRHVIGVGVSHATGGAEDASEPSFVPADLLSTRAYLSDLHAWLWNAMDEGMQASEVLQHKGLDSYADWVGYGERQAFNLLRAWREIEPRWMDADPSSSPPALGEFRGATQQPVR